MDPRSSEIRIKPKPPAVLLAIFIAAAWGRAQAPLQAFTDHSSYDAGSEVQLKFVFPSANPSLPASLNLMATVQYAGQNAKTENASASVHAFKVPAEGGATDFLRLWQIPAQAETGRYEVSLEARDAASGAKVLDVPDAASFVVYRKLVRIERIELGKTFYHPGDPVSCSVTIRNLTSRPLDDLRVEFSDRYWPWIAGPAEAARSSVVPLDPHLSLDAESESHLRSEHIEVAPEVKQPATHQYAVVVWDRGRKNVLDIAFSQLIFVRPAGAPDEAIYPGQYTYPTLASVDTKSYRDFDSPQLPGGAVQFDTSRTMFPASSEGTVAFTVGNPTSQAWQGVTIRARLLAPDGSEVAGKTVAEKIDLAPSASPLPESADFNFPQTAGLYRAEVSVLDASGKPLAASGLELGVNSLPRSILIFCAHEDDEGGYSGLAQAAIENHIPIHYVYFTSGDAGSCDMYYQHSCSPGEAMNFGALRMDETRASLGHLGVPRDDILFLGLPDGGSGQIWYYHAAATNPFLDVLLATDRAPYQGLFRPNLPYARDSVVEAVQEIIKKFHPQVICTAHPPSVGHIDHIVNNYFVVKALQGLVGADAVPSDFELLVDRVYDPKAQPPTPYHYQSMVFHVSGEAAARAQESWWFYQSQGGNRAEGHIRGFKQLPRTEEFRRILDWQEHAGWNEKP